MPKKRSTRNSNNTSINVAGNESTGTNSVNNEEKDSKKKSTPYYSWW